MKLLIMKNETVITSKKKLNEALINFADVQIKHPRYPYSVIGYVDWKDKKAVFITMVFEEKEIDEIQGINELS